MPIVRKRSRSATEQRFQDAVLDLVADSGCAEIGVNLVAERAGADKVLIYRYFGGLEGLLDRVAESRSWLPSADELLTTAGHTAEEQLRNIFRAVDKHIRQDAATHQIAIWRHAVKNPLTEKYCTEWETLWKKLAEGFSRKMSYENRKKWDHAIGLLAIMIHSKTTGDPVEEKWINSLSSELEPAELGQETAYEDVDVLPTNLL